MRKIPPSLQAEREREREREREIFYVSGADFHRPDHLGAPLQVLSMQKH